MMQDRSQISWIKRKADGHLHFESQAEAGPNPATDPHKHPVRPEEVIRHAAMECNLNWKVL